MQRDDLSAWLRLTLTKGVGNDAARRLLRAFGLPHAIFEQTEAALRQVVSAAQARSLQAVPDALPTLLDTTWRWLTEPAGGPPRRLLTLADADYPATLLNIEDPPLMLYLLGRDAMAQVHWSTHAPHCLAMVGSRNPTAQGRLHAQAFAESLAASGLTIVSGMALGIDAAAHEGALLGAAEPQRWATLAVVGTGLDRVYPRQHRELAHRIAAQGLLISEYPLGTPPLAANFPKRNRLISGLSQGTLVVEAALASGSLVTARLAVEQGREVFAIPGSIHSPQSRGCHALIRQGAKLVESAQDVLEELKLGPMPGDSARAQPATPLSATPQDEDALLSALGFEPTGLDALQARTGLPTPELQARLLTLELDGRVARLPGGLFQRIGQA